MELNGKTAFITGAASGIGFAFAERCASEGMTLLLADLEEDRLKQVVSDFNAKGTKAEAYVLDVSDPEAYKRVATEVLNAYGAPYILFNNAGIARGGTGASTATIDDWRWTVKVNILGVGYGLSLFVPKMIESGAKGYIVNTGSITGLLTSPGGAAIYGMSKHAVVAISEALTHEVRPHGMHVTVLCPGSVATNIVDQERTIPKGVDASKVSIGDPALVEYTKQYVSEGLKPEDVIARTFKAMEERRTYVVTHPEYKDDVILRHRMIEDAIVGEPETDVTLLATSKALLNLKPLT